MKKLLSLISFVIFIISCEKPSESTHKLFTPLSSKQTGITFSNTLTENDSLNYFSYAYIYMGGGVASGDINNDGLIDLFFTGNMVPNKLYLNKGNLQFEDISQSSGVEGDQRWFTGVTMADINGDGYLDIYCAVGGKFRPKNNLLYINNGDNTFTEKAEEYGLDDVGNSVQTTFFDYDLDGDLDVYIANYPPTRFNAPNSYYGYKMSHTKDFETDKLFRNDGEIFTNVTDQAGLRSFGLSLSATIGDLNHDGWPDIYVSNDFSTPDYMFINNQDGSFTDHLKQSTKQTSFYGMGVDIADFNNDALLDIIQVDMMAKDNRRAKANMASMNPNLFWGTVNAGFHYQYMHNQLQVNNGNLAKGKPDFSNISKLANISSTDWSWGPLFADLDNDGWKDIFISNGTRREINNRDYFAKIAKDRYSKDSLLAKSLAIPSEKIDNFVYQNNKDLTFRKVNQDWGLEFKGFSNGCVYVDLDNDGDLEIVTNNIDDEASIFENHSANFNNHFTLKFKGSDKNKYGLGTKAYIFTDSLQQFQELTLTRGFQSSVAPQLHFGLGQFEKIDSLIVVWPDGKIHKQYNIHKNQTQTLLHQEATNQPVITTKSSEKLFENVQDSLLFPKHKHIENYFDDFNLQVLLPHKLSQLGPALAVGDLNGDQLDDILIGGASQNAATLYFQTKDGFKKQRIKDFALDGVYEDIDAVILDVDNDGDNDIYMVSGGNEFSKTSDILQDRLYINEGQGRFKKSNSALPRMITSGAKVVPHDFDKDGDLDLFIGGRLVPGEYPLPAHSYILENVSTTNHPKFIDITEKVAPKLIEAGMVTHADWADIDQDGWDDLIIVGEWMPITVFRNNNGIFQDITTKLGLEHTTGWWFSIKHADFDHDGDLDFIVGNNGLNYKYKANEKETFDMYINDFDKNQSHDIVLSYYNDGEKFPVRGRECSSQQIPAIKKKFKNYETFSKATLEDIYTEKDLEKSQHFQVKSFASIYLENDNGSFKIKTLPNLAQLSSINEILIDDYDNDGYKDALIAGNLYGSEVETPRNDASIGLLLKGNGRGDFTPIKGKDSGFYVPGDVKNMAFLNMNNHYIH